VIEALVVSNLILWVAVVVLCGVVLALLRQVGVLHERIAPAGALVGRDGPAVGDPAPRVDAPDRAGLQQRIGAPSESGSDTLLFFLSPGCPVCKTLIPVLHSIRAAESAPLEIVFASDGDPGEHDALVREFGLEDEVYVISAELGLAYQVGRLPYAVLIDAGGVVRARGLVNTREHLESLFEARERGVASVQEWAQRRAETPRVASGASQ
jgi:methylamine dehydrogenase accessory protein MauD